jgi:hypothetical protein
MWRDSFGVLLWQERGACLITFLMVTRDASGKRRNLTLNFGQLL